MSCYDFFFIFDLGSMFALKPAYEYIRTVKIKNSYINISQLQLFHVDTVKFLISSNNNCGIGLSAHSNSILFVIELICMNVSLPTCVYCPVCNNGSRNL